ncbi:MAG TPA: DUF2924 domain-containing protein [Edaphobacter sp.]|nr:DUF2924 domain-containing protein [Edaphobacter sp.]
MLSNPSAQLLEKLPSLSKAQLKELWRKSSPPSPRLRRELMLPILAFRLQEISHGGLTERALMNLREAINALPLKGQSTLRKFRAGTRIVREWKGKIHEVQVTDEGFEYEGETFKSLSPIACRITGTHWSGPAFFGTKERKP